MEIIQAEYRRQNQVASNAVSYDRTGGVIPSRLFSLGSTCPKAKENNSWGVFSLRLFLRTLLTWEKIKSTMSWEKALKLRPFGTMSRKRVWFFLTCGFWEERMGRRKTGGFSGSRLSRFQKRRYRRTGRECGQKVRLPKGAEQYVFRKRNSQARKI